MTVMVRAFLILVLASAPAFAETIHPGYRWDEIGDGIYLHSREDPLAGPIDGNSTIIVNDEDVFVVDTHIDPAAARAVIAKIRTITDKPVTHVVNTHWHDDHVNGNHAYRQAFPESAIVAHPATIAALKEEWSAMEEQRKTSCGSIAGRDLVAEADAIAAEDPQRAIAVRGFAGYCAALAPELPSLELVYPNTPVAAEQVFRRGDRRIVLRWLGRGNTDGDLLVWLPDDDVLITGDVLVAPIPFAFDSPMLDWIETLERVAEIGAGTIVPGHGPVQRDRGHLERVRSLLAATVAAVEKAHADGVAYGDLGQAVDLSEQERRFAGDDPVRGYAWRSFFVAPGLPSAWKALGYREPEAAEPAD